MNHNNDMMSQSSATSPSSPPLIWITQGKTQHAAFLLEEESTDGKKKQIKVRWATSNKISWLDAGDVVLERELTPRRGRRQPSPTCISSPPRSSSKRKRTTSPKETVEGGGARRISFGDPSTSVQGEENDNNNTSELATDKLGAVDGSNKVVKPPDSDDDSSIEVLLTILPPSPKKKKASPNNPVSMTVPSSLTNDKFSVLEEGQTREDTNGGYCTKEQKSTETPCTSNGCGLALEAAGTDPSSTDSRREEEKHPMEVEQTTLSQQRDPFVEEEDDRKIPARKDEYKGEQGPQLKESNQQPTTTTPPYTFLTSAYVQNLAEICHMVTMDRRWRVGPNQKSLLSWEYGDDLSAVIPFARRWRAPQAASSKNSKCYGLILCDCHKKIQDEETTTTTTALTSSVGCYSASNTSSSGDGEEALPREDDNVYLPSHHEAVTIDPREQPATNTAPHHNEGVVARSEEDAAEDRCLHLYSRMHYRKGPWFRLDNLYSRYYAPKGAGTTEQQGQQQQQASRQSGNQQSPSQAQASRQDFFNPRPAATRTQIASATSKRGSNINEKLFEEHMSALELFLKDVIRLRDMGLIRSFFDEEECGKTVGAPHGGGLTGEEQRQVLIKLGAGRSKTSNVPASKQQRRPSMINQDRSPSPSSSVENEIWNQMVRQKSISAQFKRTAQSGNSQTNNTGSSKVVLLPVIRHVNQVLFDKLATRIVEACSPTGYVASAVMRARKAAIQEKVSKVLTLFNSPQQLARNNASSGQQFGMCMLRMREAPLKSLQRCVRLMLCASSGPGSMRSDGGINGWKSIMELDRNCVLDNTKLRDAQYAASVEPPGAHSWNKVNYPGLEHRFGLGRSCCFHTAFKPLPYLEGRGNQAEQVFLTRTDFLCWEICAEFRAHADYLMEVNELLLYNERKRLRTEEGSSEGSEDSSENGGGASDSDDCGGTKAKDQERKTNIGDSTMDFLRLMTQEKRKEIVSAFVTGSVEDLQKVCGQMERDVATLFAVAEGRQPRMRTECEEILFVLCVIINHILMSRFKTIRDSEVTSFVARPWLRHLSWEACLAYILWDCIPVLEKRGFYLIALQSLELLVEGRTRSTRDLGKAIVEGSLRQIWPQLDSKQQGISVYFAHFLLSRRARGKAYDRIVIDLTHLLRTKEKTLEAQRGKGKKGKKTASKIPLFVAAFTKEVLDQAVLSSAISFSSIRTLARRLKRPLHKVLESLPSYEALELGLRLGNENKSTKADPNKYSDWIPITDHAVANSMAIEESLVGRRCSFVGHEDDPEKAAFASSLNVEQLAMEFYASGRLPECVEEPKGGWVGWHDEGGMVRALFGVLSFEVLGMDYCCRQNSIDQHQATIHLSPYQGAPFDLHVGFEIAESIGNNDKETKASGGFYLRRQDKIQQFLARLETLSRQEVSNLVWDSIAARRAYMINASRKDPSIERDILQCRTLSMVAAGFGGKMISAMLRMLFFDYRHYNGGLPDLLMVRALSENSLVPLGDWIGEAFDAKYLAELEADQRARLLGDRDDDFLGCSKVGDSGGVGTSRGRPNRGRRQQQRDASGKQRALDSLELPPKLQLHHNDKEVEVECMFVEVKSSNDRLDARQEDWLNVLDRFGNARVCKFSDGKPKGRKKAKTDGKAK